MAHLPADAWFVAQVAPQSEKRVGAMLEYKGYQHFAPTYLSHRKWSDRIKVLEEPLFPGYVFVRVPQKTLGGLLCSTPGVIRILSLGRQPISLPDTEIDAIKILSVRGKPLPTRHVTCGEKVQITDGPFAGIVGLVRKIKNRDCLIFSVQLISQSIYVDVDEFQIASLPPAARDGAQAIPAGN